MNEVNWDVEYDDNGMPIRMHWRPAVCGDPEKPRCQSRFEDRGGKAYRCVFSEHHKGPHQYAAQS